MRAVSPSTYSADATFVTNSWSGLMATQAITAVGQSMLSAVNWAVVPRRGSGERGVSGCGGRKGPAVT